MSAPNPALADAAAHYAGEQIDPLFLRAAREHLWPYVAAGPVVNIGLGYGVWDEALAAHGGPVLGVDIDAALVARFAERYPALRYVCADATRFVPDGPVQTVVASHVLEHLEDPVGALRHWARWLAPGGRVVVVVPNARSVHRELGVRMGMLREVTELNAGDRLLGHVRVYTPELWSEHLAASGLALRYLAGVSVKALSNGQLAAMPRPYVDACAHLAGPGLTSYACQLAAVLERPA